MHRAYTDDYVICEQADGWFVIERGDRELEERFARSILAEGRVDQLIEQSGGSAWGIRHWKGTCPKCNVTGSLIIARTGGFVMHMCQQPDSRCSYEKLIGPTPR